MRTINLALESCPICHHMGGLKKLVQFKRLDKAVKGLKDAPREGLRQIAGKAKDKKAKAEDFKQAKSLLKGWQQEVEEYSLALQGRQRMVWLYATDEAQNATG